MNLRTRLYRVATVVVASVGLTTAGLVVSVAPAHAAPGDLTCTIDLLDVTFSPPLSATNATTNATGGGPLIVCVSPNGQHSNLTGATITGTGTAKYQAPGVGSLIPTATVSGKATFVWDNNQEPSEFKFEVNTDPLNPKFEARITKGPLKGDIALPTGPVAIVPKVGLGTLGGFFAGAVVVNFG